MKFLTDLVRENGHKIVRYNKAQMGYEYESVFNYSQKHGGTYDSCKYYNDYVIEVGKTPSENSSDKEVVTCKYCNTSSQWGGEEGKPTMWECEDCGGIFCNDCCNIDNENDEKILCKKCHFINNI